MITTANVATSAATSAGSVVANAATGLFFGSFNRKYKKKDQKRMRYIQFKYAHAYGGEEMEDPASIIHKIGKNIQPNMDHVPNSVKNADPNSKLIMEPDGSRPANPFQDERAFDEALNLTVYPVPGHQGRFAASHAVACVSKIIAYQCHRRARTWVPGVSNPGRPNDYINMFLEEIKTWCRKQLTLDIVHAEELRCRDAYFSKLKHDNYYWCFPVESGDYQVHQVIDFVHDMVLDALEVVTREEKNKSLQVLFREMNDHVTNTFEFGKSFLAFLTSTTRKKAGVDLTHSATFDGRTFDTGKLHKMLGRVTECVMKTYVQEMKDSDERLEEARAARSRGVEYDFKQAIEAQAETSQSQQLSVAAAMDYEIAVDYDNSSAVGSVVYIIEIKDPEGHHWVLRKTFGELKQLHQAIEKEYEGQGEPLTLPPNMQRLMPSAEDYQERSECIADYLFKVVNVRFRMSKPTMKLVCNFLDCKQLIMAPSLTTMKSENIPNVFTDLREKFRTQLLYTGKGEKKPTSRFAGLLTGSSSSQTTSTHKEGQSDAAGSSGGTGGGRLSSNSNEALGGSSDVEPSRMERDLTRFRQAWGIELVYKILDAYAMLQRLCTILGWTLEINHFFVSMFGNTLAFSKLPLREIILTLKDILGKFLATSQDLFRAACQLNADLKYQWHKNLQMTEGQLNLVKFHTEKAIATINRIDTEHLDYEYQLLRLQEVASRFRPLMNRIGSSLPQIQSELQIPVRAIAADAQNSGLFGQSHQGARESLSRVQDDSDWMGLRERNTMTNIVENNKVKRQQSWNGSRGGKLLLEDGKQRGDIFTADTKLNPQSGGGSRSGDRRGGSSTLLPDSRVEELPCDNEEGESVPRDAGRPVGGLGWGEGRGAGDAGDVRGRVGSEARGGGNGSGGSLKQLQLPQSKGAEEPPVKASKGGGAHPFDDDFFDDDSDDDVYAAPATAPTAEAHKNDPSAACSVQ